jgi:hypothetical protein
MITKHTHPKDCSDHKAASADRKQHEAEQMKRQERQQVLAQAEWFGWYPPREPRRAGPAA